MWRVEHLARHHAGLHLRIKSGAPGSSEFECHTPLGSSPTSFQAFPEWRCARTASTSKCSVWTEIYQAKLQHCKTLLDFGATCICYVQLCDISLLYCKGPISSFFICFASFWLEELWFIHLGLTPWSKSSNFSRITLLRASTVERCGKLPDSKHGQCLNLPFARQNIGRLNEILIYDIWLWWYMLLRVSIALIINRNQSWSPITGDDWRQLTLVILVSAHYKNEGDRPWFSGTSLACHFWKAQRPYALGRILLFGWHETIARDNFAGL